MKKISPTPKSITQRNPTKISPSFKKSQDPKKIKYKPAKYQSDMMFRVVRKKNKVRSESSCKQTISLNKAYKLKYPDVSKIFTGVMRGQNCEYVPKRKFFERRL